MKVEVKIIDFKGQIKWIVSSKLIFVDPLYLEELVNNLAKDLI